MFRDIQSIVDLETRFWQSMVDKDAEAGQDHDRRGMPRRRPVGYDARSTLTNTRP